MHEIETARLRLRLFRPSDLEPLAALFSDREVMRYIGGGTTFTKEQVAAGLTRRIAAYQQRNYGLWAVEHKADRQIIGQCGLAPLADTDEVEVAYLFAQRYWGNGLATEAARAAIRYGFEQVGLPRIVAITYPHNLASQRVLQKIGLKYERDGHYYGVDARYFALDRAAYLPDAAPYTLHQVAEPPPVDIG